MIKRPSADKYHRKDQSRYTRRIPTGVAALDKALAGGLTKGLIYSFSSDSRCWQNDFS